MGAALVSWRQTVFVSCTMTIKAKPLRLESTDTFVDRHLGPNSEEIAKMLRTLGLSSLDELIQQTFQNPKHCKASFA